MKTIKQISNELNISKQALYKKIKNVLNESLDNHIYKHANAIFIDTAGEQIIIDYYKKGFVKTERIEIKVKEIEELKDELKEIKEELKEIKELLKSNTYPENEKKIKQIKKISTLVEDKSEKEKIAGMPSKNKKYNDILELLKQGKTQREIIKILNVSPHTITKVKKLYLN